MKYCTHCGKELLDEAVVCVGCGCPIESSEMKRTKFSVFKQNRKQLIMVFSVFFIVFAAITILLLTSSGYDRTIDMYQYLHSDFGQMGKRLSVSGAIEWQQKVDAAKAALIPYYIGIGISGVLAIASLIGDIILFVGKKKINNNF